MLKIIDFSIFILQVFPVWWSMRNLVDFVSLYQNARTGRHIFHSAAKTLLGFILLVSSSHCFGRIMVSVPILSSNFIMVVYHNITFARPNLFVRYHSSFKFPKNIYLYSIFITFLRNTNGTLGSCSISFHFILSKYW